MGGSASYKRGLPATMRLGELGLPLLADIGDVTVEFIRSSEEPGGIGEIAVPPVAPAIANALFTVTGERFRRSEEHTSELQSLMRISYAVFCLQKKKTQHRQNKTT